MRCGVLISALVLSALSLAGLRVDAQPSCAGSAAVTVPTAWFGDLFNTDPRVGTANYSWVAFDPNDSPTLQGIHTNLISFPGSSAGPIGNYVNLSASTGPNSVLATLPSYLGGASAGSLTSGTYGWSFEFTFKPTIQESWAKLMDIGNPMVNGVCRDDLLFGWSGSSNQMTFTYCDGTGVQWTITSPSNQLFTLNTWHHVTVVIQQTLASNGVGTGLSSFLMYINGSAPVPGLAITGPYPNSVYRSNADLGKSSWNDAYWAGFLDSIRIYNYALQADQAAALYLYAMGGCTNAVTFGTSSTQYLAAPSQYSAAPPSPWYSLPTSSNPGVANANYGWAQTDAADVSCGIAASHTGFFTLSGSSNPSTYGQYINLSQSSGPNSVGPAGLLPGPIGGPGSGSLSLGTQGWSFEFSFKAPLIEHYAKLFDFDNTQTSSCREDILAGWVADHPSQWSFDYCDSTGTQWNMNDIMGTVNVSTWYHVVIVLQATANNYANWYTYRNGQLYGSAPYMPMPAAVVRSNMNIGKSGWSADYFFNGYINKFNIYNNALSAPQVTSLYNTASNNGAPGYCRVARTQTEVIPPLAVFYRLDFASDPRVNPTTATYNWSLYDWRDNAADQAKHRGVLILNGGAAGSTGPYANLSAGSSSPTYVGKTLDINFGGVGTGNVLNGTAGWSFEITFKATLTETWGKMFDLGTATSCLNDIVFGWNGASQDLAFQTCDGYLSGYGLTPVYQGVVLGQWYHAVMVIQQTRTGTANYYTYINGVQTGFTALNTFYPVSYPRINSLLGKSNWNDAYWAGAIDTFTIYSQALTYSQVQGLYDTEMQTVSTTIPSCSSSASSVVVPSPWFTSTFATDPSAAAGGSDAAAYGWQLTDPSDPLAPYHPGTLVLGGGGNNIAGPYVNLVQSTGVNSIGSTLPGNIGGSSRGDVNSGTAGWSFEVTFKPTVQQTWAKLFDIGNPQVNGVCRDDLLFGWEGTAQRWTFTHCDSTGFQYTIDNQNFTAVAGQWYHVVIVIQQLKNGDGSASTGAIYTMYINGQTSLGGGNGGLYPVSVFRSNAYLGKSDWADNYWSGLVDTFNIYDYALTPAMVDSLYRNSMANCAVTRGSNIAAGVVAPPQTSGAVPNPFFQIPSSDPRQGSNYNYGWLTQDPADVSCGLNAYHQQLLVLPGSASPNNYQPYVNLSATSGPNSIGVTLPTIGGAGSGNAAAQTQGWSFELYLKPDAVETWAKVFDIGNPQVSGVCRDDILTGFNGNGPLWTFQTCDSTGQQWGSTNTFPAGIPIGKWSHMVFVIQLIPGTNYAAYYTYLNGKVYNSATNQYYPAGIQRINNDMGRSDWGADSYWSGYVDLFNVYDVALTAPQVLSRWNTVSNNGQIALACQPATPPIQLPASALFWSAEFTSDPRAAAGGASAAAYSWANSSSTDTPALAALHQGLLVLRAGSSDFVNLSMSSGPNSIGGPVPGQIGGDGTGDINAGTRGWTFEVSFKEYQLEGWGKVIDFGDIRSSPLSGTCNLDVYFGSYGPDNRNYSFGACDAWGNSNQVEPAVFISTYQWVHFVGVFQATAFGLSTWTWYQNGVSMGSLANQYYPTIGTRANMMIGKSNWADPLWAGEIDFVRIYSQAVTAQQANNLWLISQGQAPDYVDHSQSGGSKSSSLSGGAIAGIVVGVVVGVAICVGIIVCLLCCGGRLGKRSEAYKQHEAEPSSKATDVEMASTS